MDFRIMTSVFLNLIAFSTPLIFLASYFGGEVRVNPESTWHLSAIGGSVLFAFTVATIGGRLLPKEEDSLPKQIIRLFKTVANANKG